MGCGYVVVSILLCISFAASYLAFVESIDTGGNPETNEKNTTVSIPNPFSQNEGGNIISHYAMWHTEPGKFYGLRADMSIWGSPNQEYSQESGAAIQMYCAEGGHYRLIQAGFHVAPSLYHNRDVRFFTYWTKDTKTAGCYNMQCKGFVPARGAALVPGQAIAPQSTYGEVDHYARLSINKDPKTGAWILYRHDLQAPSFLGHFPSELCPGEAAQIQALTGFVNYQKNARGPPMGSGHFPDNEDPKKSAYFKQVKAYDSEGHAWNPITTVMLPLADKPDCYRPSDFLLDFKKGYTFYYVGPSGCVGWQNTSFFCL